ncbi:hypothetical protein [Hoeflea sp.]|uniref:hypothetical protein n=1 Tax=Hoeflea sp. TaxID=1940281 RepID=UPI0037496908
MTVGSDRISDAPIETGGMPTVPVNSDPLTRDPIIDQKLGWVGKFFGYGDEKKGNIAGLAFVFSSLMLAFCVIGQFFIEEESARGTISGLITPLFGLITGLLGYATGQKMSSD